MKIKHTIQTALALSALAAISGCGDAPTSQGETALSPANNAPGASGTSSFDKVTAKLDKGGDLFLYYNTKNVIRSLDDFVTSLAPLTRQTLLQNLNDPLTEQEKKLTGRWKEIDEDDPNTSCQIIFRNNRTYSYLMVSPQEPTPPEPTLDSQPAVDDRFMGHGMWKIKNNQLYLFDMVWNDEKVPLNIGTSPFTINNVSETAYSINMFDNVIGEATRIKGEPIAKFTEPEMTSYNSVEALSTFNISEAFNKAKDLEGEIDFGPNHQLDQPLNLVANISRALLDQAGIGNIKGVGMSSTKPQADLFRNKVFIHLDEAKPGGKLWSILGSEPHEFEMLKLLPADTALAFSHEIHPQTLLDWIPSLLEAGGAPPQIKGQFEQSLQMANAQFGLDGLLASFDNEIGVFATLDDSKKVQLPPPLGEAPLPGFAIMAKVKDDKLSDFVLGALQQAAGPQMEKRNVAGVEMLVITEPAPLPVPLAPAFFRLGDFFVIANTEALAKRIVASHNGDEKNLTTTDEFQHLAKGLDLKGNHFFFASEKVSAVGTVMSPAIQQLLQEAPIPQNSLNLDWKGTLDIQSLGVVRMEKDGIMVENQSRKGIVNSVIMQTGMLPVMIGTGLLLPELAKAKQKAQGITCMNHMKQLALALYMYADDHGGNLPWQVSGEDGGSMEYISPRSDKNAMLDANGDPIFDENGWRHMIPLMPYLASKKIFSCPTLNKTFSSGEEITKRDVSYWFLTNKKTNLQNNQNPATSIMFICPHHQDAFGAAFADGHIEMMKWPRTVERFAEQNPPIKLQRFTTPSTPQ